jgi:glycosyltransferase involved in cell wall biosynthesis
VVITTPSESSRRHIAEVGGDPAKIHLIPSGTTQDWLDLGEEQVDRVKLGLPNDEFVWTYAGNLGLAQGLETAVRAAAELGRGYRLVVVGDGPVRRELEDLTARVAPDSVVFAGLVSRKTSGHYLRASDALLVSLASAPGLDYAVPSKLYDCCAIGRPIVVAAAGETSRLARVHGIGLTVEPGKVTELAAAIRRLREESALGTRLVRSARAFAEQNLREDQADRLVEVLASVARRP